MAHMANQLTLGVKDVHVWRASLDQTPAIVEQLRQLLSADERIRADRFHFENDRQHFVVGRGCLRMLLSRYLEIPPGEIQFSYGAQGSRNWQLQMRSYTRSTLIW